MTHPYLLPLLEQFTQHADPAQAAPMAAYMRDQFPFLGIKSPQRAELTRSAAAGCAGNGGLRFVGTAGA